MRGNEDDQTIEMADFFDAFPIPMRGNEFWVSRHQSGSAVVPNPHEG